MLGINAVNKLSNMLSTICSHSVFQTINAIPKIQTNYSGLKKTVSLGELCEITVKL